MIKGWYKRGLTLRERIIDSSEKVEGGCWIWKKATTSMKSKLTYGKITTGSKLDGTRKNELAHRVSFSEFKGKIPKSALVLHKCDTPLCVNPAHLFLGSYSENMKDMLVKGRQRKSLKDTSQVDRGCGL